MRHGAPYITTMTLAIINREPHGGWIPPGVLVWRTCLREVLFAPAAEPLRGAAGHTLLEGRAYRVMLEILCGLQSPMIGETQVVAQFRSFLAGLPREHTWAMRIGQRLLADARRVRTAHLQRLGGRSYGSAVREHLGPSETVVLIGTGKLAGDLLPHLTGSGRQVHQWGRVAAVRTLPGVGYRTLTSIERDAGPATRATLVVAAPAPASTIALVAAAYPGLIRLIDLRAEAKDDPVAVAVPMTTLRDLLAVSNEAGRFVQARVEAARAEIDDCGCRYERRDEVRPFGWDDLCA